MRLLFSRARAVLPAQDKPALIILEKALDEGMKKVTMTLAKAGEGCEFLLDGPDQMRRAQALLEKSMKRPKAAPFLKPVDPEEDGCEDYLQTIKHPMDLGTVKEDLDGNMYDTLAEVAANIRLTFKNAMMYNSERSTFYSDAKELQEQFDQDLAEVLKETKEEPPVTVGEVTCCVCGLSVSFCPIFLFMS